MANVYLCSAVAIATVEQTFCLIAERKPAILIELVSERYAFVDFKQWLTLIFADCFCSAKEVNLI